MMSLIWMPWLISGIIKAGRLVIRNTFHISRFKSISPQYGKFIMEDEDYSNALISAETAMRLITHETLLIVVDKTQTGSLFLIKKFWIG